MGEQPLKGAPLKLAIGACPTTAVVPVNVITIRAEILVRIMKNFSFNFLWFNGNSK
jgi:hypothetical protein